MDPTVVDAEVTVVGSGVVGLFVALYLANAKLQVVLLDASPMRGASFVAAGMLAPVFESRFGEPQLTSFNLSSLKAWDRFLLTTDSFPPGLLSKNGSLVIAFDKDDRGTLDHYARYLSELELKQNFLTSKETRDIEPLLSPLISGSLYSQHDCRVDARALLKWLMKSALRAGVVHTKANALKFSKRLGYKQIKDRSHVVMTSDFQTIHSQLVIVCAGVNSSPIYIDDEIYSIPIRPIKGEILRLKHLNSDMVPKHTIRAIVEGRNVYIVPTSSGEIIVGATMLEKPDDRMVRAGAAQELLADAFKVLPSLEEAIFVSAESRARPNTPDELPAVGEVTEGIFIASGHFRNAFLQAPLTAEIILDKVNRRYNPHSTLVDPWRFIPPVRNYAT